MMDTLKLEDAAMNGYGLAQANYEAFQTPKTHIVRVRGLPWSCTSKELASFFEGVNVLNGEQGVHFVYTNEGRPSGEAFFSVAGEADVNLAKEKNHKYLGTRYIEVFESSEREMQWTLSRSGTHVGFRDAVIRLRGLPYSATKEDIAAFFTGMPIAPNGIMITMNQFGKPSGESFVQFLTEEAAEKALERNKQRIGTRYIEIFKSSIREAQRAMGQQPDMSSYGPTVQMEMPYDYGGFNAAAPTATTTTPSYMTRPNARVSPYSRPGPGPGPGTTRWGGKGEFSSHFSSAMATAPAVPLLEDIAAGGDGDAGMRRKSHVVRMRGLPYSAVDEDIYEFYRPLTPLEIKWTFDEKGRTSGECEVYFSSHGESCEAMKYDKQHMGHRYIELFLKSHEEC